MSHRLHGPHCVNCATEVLKVWLSTPTSTCSPPGATATCQCCSLPLVCSERHPTSRPRKSRATVSAYHNAPVTLPHFRSTYSFFMTDQSCRFAWCLVAMPC